VCIDMCACARTQMCVCAHMTYVWMHTLWIYSDTDIMQIHTHLQLHIYIHKMGDVSRTSMEEEREIKRGFSNKWPTQLHISISQEGAVKLSGSCVEEPYNKGLFC